MPVAATLEERVAYVEGRIEEHSRAWEDIRDMIIHLEGRINALDQKVDRRIEALAHKFSRYFLWIIGIQVTIFLSIIAIFLRR